MKKLVLVLIFIVALSISTLAAQSVEPIRITWAATSTTSGYYPMNIAFTELIMKHIPGVEITVLETGGGADNLGLVSRGEADFGQAGDMDVYQSQHKMDLYKDVDYSDARYFIACSPSIFYWVVREDSGITSLEELDGQKYSPGPSGSTMAATSLWVSELFGFSPDWQYGTTRDALDAIKDGRWIGLGKTGSAHLLDSALLELDTAVPTRALGLNPEQEKKILERFPYFLIYESAQFGIRGYGTTVGTFVSKNVPDDLVYKAAEAIYENMDYVIDAYPAAKGIDIIKEILNGNAWIHSGLVKYLQDKGYNVPERIIPPEMK